VDLTPHEVSVNEDAGGRTVYFPTYNYDYGDGMTKASAFAGLAFGNWTNVRGYPIITNLSHAYIVVAWGDFENWEPVGCATVGHLADPGPQAVVFYDYVAPYPRTNPNTGVALAVDLNPGTAYGVRATVLDVGETANSSTHVLVQGALHVFFVFFSRDEFPENPTPSWCQ